MAPCSCTHLCILMIFLIVYPAQRSAGRKPLDSMYKDRHLLEQLRQSSSPLPLGLCMAYYESRYNTTAETVLKDGSIDYGIFQINSFTWCRNAKKRQKNHCHVACSGTVSDSPGPSASGTKIRTEIEGHTPLSALKLRGRIYKCAPGPADASAASPVVCVHKCLIPARVGLRTISMKTGLNK